MYLILWLFFKEMDVSLPRRLCGPVCFLGLPLLKEGCLPVEVGRWTRELKWGPWQRKPHYCSFLRDGTVDRTFGHTESGGTAGHTVEGERERAEGGEKSRKGRGAGRSLVGCAVSSKRPYESWSNWEVSHPVPRRKKVRPETRYCATQIPGALALDQALG